MDGSSINDSKYQLFGTSKIASEICFQTPKEPIMP